MIIDTHAQLGLKEKGGSAGAKSRKKEWIEGHINIFGPREKTIDDNIADMQNAGVDKSVVVAIDAETTYNFKVSNEEVAEAVKRYPDKLIGFAGVDPHKGVLAVNELEYAVQVLGLCGLKLMPHLLKLYPNDPVIYPVYRKAMELDIPVLFHTGTQFHTGTKLKYCRPLYLDEVAVDFPHLKIIIAHFGWPWYAETIAVVQRNPNVFFNIAGWSPRYIPEMVVTYMNTLLSHKVLFGSDYPLIPRKRILEELRQLPLKESTIHKMTTLNPQQVLNIGR